MYYLVHAVDARLKGKQGPRLSFPLTTDGSSDTPVYDVVIILRHEEISVVDFVRDVVPTLRYPQLRDARLLFMRSTASFMNGSRNIHDSSQ